MNINLETTDFGSGTVLLIDKPLHWTSFDVVKKIRTAIKIPKVGHAGTLDPLATGLLIVCTGKFTKRINEFMGMEKEYTGTITLGAVTASYDLETEPEHFKAFDYITKDQIHRATEQFTGEISQIPPNFSAIKKNGKVAYIEARKGNLIKLEPRKINIYSFEIEDIQLPNINFKVRCSTGTYIRSLANDFGNHLGCGGYLSSLRRTKIGHFSVNETTPLENFVR